MALKMEVGKNYRTRDGRHVYVAAQNPRMHGKGAVACYVGWFTAENVAAFLFWNKYGKRFKFDECGSDIVEVVDDAESESRK